MSYYSDAVTDIAVSSAARSLRVTARSTQACVQCYLRGELVACERPVNRAVEFNLSVLDEMDVVHLLAVDLVDAETDYFSEAFPDAAEDGNRIEISLLTAPGYLPTDEGKFYRGDAGDASATELLAQQLLYPGGARCGGWGGLWGYCWGVGAYGSGWGNVWGYQWGYEPVKIVHHTDPLPPGDYPVKITIIDAAENESTAATETVAHDTYPRPASDLTIDSYTKGTDTLALTFTESEDL